MDEKRKEELVNILKMFDEASLANQKYILGYAEGYVAGLGMKA